MEDHPNRYLYSKLINMSCEAVGELSFKGRVHTVHVLYLKINVTLFIFVMTLSGVIQFC